MELAVEPPVERKRRALSDVLMARSAAGSSGQWGRPGALRRVGETSAAVVHDQPSLPATRRVNGTDVPAKWNTSRLALGAAWHRAVALRLVRSNYFGRRAATWRGGRMLQEAAAASVSDGRRPQNGTVRKPELIPGARNSSAAAWVAMDASPRYARAWPAGAWSAPNVQPSRRRPARANTLMGGPSCITRTLSERSAARRTMWPRQSTR